MSSIDEVNTNTQELGKMVRRANVPGPSRNTQQQQVVSNKYNSAVDSHTQDGGDLDTQLEVLLKEYAALKKEYYSTYASISNTDNNERISKFNRQVQQYWEYDDYVRRVEDEYRTATDNWSRNVNDMDGKWNQMMTTYGNDNKKYIDGKIQRHNKAIDQYREVIPVKFNTIADYYVQNYITRRNELYCSDVWESAGYYGWWGEYTTGGNSSVNSRLEKVSRWNSAGWSATIPAQRVSGTWVQQGDWWWTWTMGGQKASNATQVGSYQESWPWGETPGAPNSGTKIWYGHGNQGWNDEWGEYWSSKNQEEWGKQPLKVPFIFYKPFFVDPQGPTTGYMYGWCDDRCRVYVNNQDVYGKVIEGGWGDRITNESGPIKLNKGFNMIMIVAMNLGGPAGMSWTMWNTPNYWKDTVGGSVDYNKVGIIVRTDETWRCIMQKIEAPALDTYHWPNNLQPYSDQNLTLPSFITNDTTLVKEYNPSSSKRLQAAKNVRYVRVVCDEKAYMQIAQIAVYPMENQGKNIAQGKPTSCNLNSTDMWDNNCCGSTPEKAVDGVLSAKPFPELYHSSGNTIPWWEVDLEGVYNIAKIVYYNRSDCCWWRSMSLRLQFMDENRKILWTGEPFNDDAAMQTFAFGDATFVEAAPSVPEFGTGYNEENVLVGPSDSNEKRITLPRDNMAVGNAPINEQSPEWSDKFETSVEGRTLIVSRTDGPYGWGQNLVLKSVTYPNAKPSPPVIMPNEWPTMDNYKTPQIALLEQISDKSHQIITLSEKIHANYSTIAQNSDLKTFSTERDSTYKNLSSQYLALLAERRIVEDAITEFDSVLTDQGTSELRVDTDRLLYLGWSITLSILIILLALHISKPPASALSRTELVSVLVIILCFAIFTKYVGKTNLILPVCVVVLLSILAFIYYRGRSQGVLSSSNTFASPTLTTNVAQ